MTKTILFVEDSASVRQVMNSTLSREGYQVILACDGQDALTKLDGSKIHLIISDVNMPNMDGIEALVAIRTLEASQGGHVPVIMATSHDEPGDAARFKRSGADGYLSKPLEIERLQSEISRVLAQR